MAILPAFAHGCTALRYPLLIEQKRFSYAVLREISRGPGDGPCMKEKGAMDC